MQRMDVLTSQPTIGLMDMAGFPPAARMLDIQPVFPAIVILHENTKFLYLTSVVLLVAVGYCFQYLVGRGRTCNFQYNILLHYTEAVYKDDCNYLLLSHSPV